MLQFLRKYLEKYHELFVGEGCSGLQLQELMVMSINSDSSAQQKAVWKGKALGNKPNVTIVSEKGAEHNLKIKSGTIERSQISLSGNRLGRFAKRNQPDFEKITNFVNEFDTDVLSIPYSQDNNKLGRSHSYSVYYIEAEMFSGIQQNKWEQNGDDYIQKNNHGVTMMIKPSMSWQLWWWIPVKKAERADEFTIT